MCWFGLDTISFLFVDVCNNEDVSLVLGEELFFLFSLLVSSWTIEENRTVVYQDSLYQQYV